MRIENIRKIFENDREVLKGIQLSFEQKGLVFILGESGAGKSTLLQVMGLLDLNFEGQIQYGAHTITKENKKTADILREYVDFIFQDYNLINSLSVQDNLSMAVELAGKTEEADKTRQVVKYLGIEKLMDRSVTDLSGGEKQRVAIARAILRGNPVILADEPTGNLDKNNSKNIFELLKELSKERLVIIVSHNETAAYEYADRIVRMSDGEIVEDVDKGYSKNILMEEKQLEKKKINLNHWIRKITAKNISMRKKKMIPAFVTMLLCLFSFGMVLGIESSMDKIMNEINVDVLENDKMQILDCDNTIGKRLISEQFIEDIKHSKNVKKCVPYYTETVYITSKDGKRYNSTYTAVDGSEFFDNRYEDLEGKMLKNKDEVVMSSKLAQTIFGDTEWIGKKLKFTTVSDMDLECTVVGIRTEVSDLPNTDLYISSELSEDISKELINLPSQTVVFDEEGQGDSFVAETRFADTESKSWNPDIIYGKDITAENEVLLHIECVNSFLSYEDMGAPIFSVEDLINGKLSKKYINQIIGTKLKLMGTGEFTELANIKVVGIYAETNENAKDITEEISFLMSEKLRKSLHTKHYNTADVYLKSIQDSPLSETKQIVEQYNYQLFQPSGNIGISVYTKLSTIMLIFALFTILILIISFVMIHYATKVNILDRIYEIGVLKSLGAEEGLIKKMFFYENMLFGGSVSICSFILLFLVSKLKLIKISGISIMNITIQQAVLLILFGIGVTVFAGMKEVRKVSKMPIVAAIREKHK